MKNILQHLSEKTQEQKSNDELKLVALSGFTFGVLFELLFTISSYLF